MLEAGGSLSQSLNAARKLVDGVYTSPHAMQDLLEDLRLAPSAISAATAATAAAQHGSPFAGGLPATQPLTAGTFASPAAAAAAAAGEGVSRLSGGLAATQLDLTEGPKDKVYRVLLVPEYFDSHDLQQQLGDVPLWRFLASPVAVFTQGPGRGPLMHFVQLAKQHAQGASAAAAAAGPGAAARGGLQLSGDAAVGLRLPDAAVVSQVYRDGLAVVADAAVLKHCSTEELQQLMLLLRQARELLVGQGGVEAAVAGAVLHGAAVYLAVAKQDLDVLPNEQQELLQQGRRESRYVVLPLLHRMPHCCGMQCFAFGLRLSGQCPMASPLCSCDSCTRPLQWWCATHNAYTDLHICYVVLMCACSVLLLDELMSPSSLAAVAAAEDPVVAAATQLAAAQQQHLRHVFAISPDPADAISSQPQSPVTSNVLAAAQVATDAVASLVAAAAAGGKGSGGVQQQRRSTSKGSKGGGSGQRLADSEAALAVKAIARWRLVAGAKDPRLINGTFSQLLQFLACVVSNSSREAKQGGAAAAAEMVPVPSAVRAARSSSQGQSAGGVRGTKL
jgi:hypothetical protein